MPFKCCNLYNSTEVSLKSWKALLHSHWFLLPSCSTIYSSLDIELTIFFTMHDFAKLKIVFHRNSMPSKALSPSTIVPLDLQWEDSLSQFNCRVSKLGMTTLFLFTAKYIALCWQDGCPCNAGLTEQCKHLFILEKLHKPTALYLCTLFHMYWQEIRTKRQYGIIERVLD